MSTKHIVLSKKIYGDDNIIKDYDRNTIFASKIIRKFLKFTFKVYQAIEIDSTNKIYIVCLNDLYLYDAKLDELKIFITNILEYDSNFLVIILSDNTKIFVSQNRQIINTKSNENLE
ncbi:hypothetical protein A3Q56_05358 [Intoshia linei]|uniref:Uncharacterized protein n=1 Tax=Intoshia linei TaxID=1819745 RepID=A0A177AZJ1_9BILA|nr:hypothetical protein A3Q56_05358 [Intoshia linei]